MIYIMLILFIYLYLFDFIGFLCEWGLASLFGGVWGWPIVLVHCSHFTELTVSELGP